ncbi:unnamed protein product, partial [Nesidiocoris tenuis]
MVTDFATRSSSICTDDSSDSRHKGRFHQHFEPRSINEMNPNLDFFIDDRRSLGDQLVTARFGAIKGSNSTDKRYETDGIHFSLILWPIFH